MSIGKNLIIDAQDLVNKDIPDNIVVFIAPKKNAYLVKNKL